MSTPPKATRWQQVLGNKKPPKVVTVGMENAQALQRNPVEDHKLPYGSEKQHTLSRSCVCRPKVRQDKGSWWRVEVMHFVLESEDPTDWQEWEDLKESEDRRRGSR